MSENKQDEPQAEQKSIVFKGICQGLNRYGKLEIQLEDFDFSQIDFTIKHPMFRLRGKPHMRIGLGLSQFDPALNDLIKAIKGSTVEVECGIKAYDNEFGKGRYYEFMQIL